MQIELTGGGTASSDGVQGLERVIGMPLAHAFYEFVATSNGAEASPNCFPVGGDSGASLSRFIPVKEIPGEMRYIDELPPQAFPIAWADGGNYVIID